MDIYTKSYWVINSYIKYTIEFKWNKPYLLGNILSSFGKLLIQWQKINWFNQILLWKFWYLGNILFVSSILEVRSAKILFEGTTILDDTGNPQFGLPQCDVV